MSDANLTERQAKWFASVRGGLERETGKSMAEWIAIARACPETGHRARLRWFKESHGLLQNRASLVLSEAFEFPMGWNDPDALMSTLWTDHRARALFEALDSAIVAFPGVTRTARKGYTAWSRKVQFAAARPINGERIMVGLAVDPEISAGLSDRKSESWSERLKAKRVIASLEDIDSEFTTLLKSAWDNA
jgi:hypothetical protein